MGDVKGPEDELLARARRGDQDAFLALYRTHQGSVYRFALHMSGSRSVAEDVTQETFMVLLRDSTRFDPKRASLGPYLLGVARHLLLANLRSRQRLVPLEQAAETEALEPEVDQPDPVSRLVRQEAVSAVRAAVLSLPIRYREVVVLCELQEKSYEEAASILRCAAGTVRSRLHRGRALLLKKLQGRESSRDPVGAKSQRCVV